MDLEVLRSQDLSFWDPLRSRTPPDLGGRTPNDPIWTPNGPPLGPPLDPQNGPFTAPPGSYPGELTPFGHFSVVQYKAILSRFDRTVWKVPKRGPKSDPFFGPKRGQKGVQKGTLFGSILGPYWDPLLDQDYGL